MPLDYYFALINQANERLIGGVTAQGGDWEVKQEQSIAECMKRQGFTYFPRDVKRLVDGSSDIVWGLPPAFFTIDVPWLPEDLAEVERVGYGRWDPVEAAAAGPVSQIPDDIPADPNADYVASLSAQARREYDVAMYGPEWAEYDLSTFETVAAPEVGGCAGAAWEAYPEPAAKAWEESPEETYRDLIALIRVQGDPYARAVEEEGKPPDVADFLGAAQVDALDAEWLACFTDEYGEVVIPDPGAFIDPKSLPEGAGISLPHALRHPHSAWVLAQFVGLDGGFWLEPAPPDPPAEYWSLAGRPKEVEIAVADFKCREKTDYVDRFLEIMRTAQEQFVAAHQDELNEMAAVIEQYVAG
jgi:hypothetical protein